MTSPVEQSEIYRVWDAVGVVQTPGVDMSNECRLAARIVHMERERDALGKCFAELAGVRGPCGRPGVIESGGRVRCRECAEKILRVLEDVVRQARMILKEGVS